MMMLVKRSAVLVASPLVALIIDVDICSDDRPTMFLASTTSLHLPVLDQIAFSFVLLFCAPEALVTSDAQEDLSILGI